MNITDKAYAMNMLKDIKFDIKHEGMTAQDAFNDAFKDGLNDLHDLNEDAVKTFVASKLKLT